MTMQTETWARIPGHPDYEASTLGRVRSFKTGTAHVLAPSQWKGLYFFTLDGEELPLYVIMEQAHGEGALFTIQDLERDLTPYELSEIREAEGNKPAHLVAPEFRLDADRVRSVWDGRESWTR